MQVPREPDRTPAIPVAGVLLSATIFPTVAWSCVVPRGDLSISVDKQRCAIEESGQSSWKSTTTSG